MRLVLLWVQLTLERRIKAGETVTGTPSAWEKVFSTQEGCGVGQDPVTTKGASYRLFAEVNGELSANEVQFVLD